MSWPERIENYRRKDNLIAVACTQRGGIKIGIPFLSHDNGWTYGTWFIRNSYEKATNYYGGFQGDFLKRIATLPANRCNVRRRSGNSATYTTVSARPACHSAR